MCSNWAIFDELVDGQASISKYKLADAIRVCSRMTEITSASNFD